jgi:hypothetical protein
MELGGLLGTIETVAKVSQRWVRDHTGPFPPHLSVITLINYSIIFAKTADFPGSAVSSNENIFRLSC